MKMGCKRSREMSESGMGMCLVCNLRLSWAPDRIGRQVVSEGRSDTAALLADSRQGCMWVVACRRMIEAAMAEGDGQMTDSWANLIAAWETD